MYKVTIDDIQAPKHIEAAVEEFAKANKDKYADDLVTFAHEVAGHVMLAVARGPTSLTAEMIDDLEERYNNSKWPNSKRGMLIFGARDWQKRMFLRPATALSAEVKAVIAEYEAGTSGWSTTEFARKIDAVTKVFA